MDIKTVYQSYRKKPYVARWYEGGRMRNRFFSSEKARAEFVRNFSKTAAGQDPALLVIKPHKLIRWQQAAQMAPEWEMKATLPGVGPGGRSPLSRPSRCTSSCR